MIIPYIDKIASLTDWQAKPVLITGKGPSFASRPEGLEDKYHVVCVNQTASYQHGVLAVMNDIESWLDTEPVNPDMALALPAVPHIYQYPGNYGLDHWAKIEKSTRSLHEQGLLYAFDLRTTPMRKYPDQQQIMSVFSSTESAIEILALAGVKHMFTVGVDGGVTKSEEFQNTEVGDTYDRQFKRIKELQSQYGIKIEPLLQESQEQTIEILLEKCNTRDDIPVALSSAGLTGEWVELGVAVGTYSQSLLHHGKPDLLWSIDRWSGDRGHDTGQYMSAVKNLRPYSANNNILRASFSEALGMFRPESLDFVYIDGYAHTGQDSGKTLKDWWPKIKAGGVMAGHDYHEQWPETVAAVDCFAKEQSLTVLTTKEAKWPSWMIVKSSLNSSVVR